MKQVVLFVLMLFTVSILRGQSNSFKVENQVFEFQIPENWVIDEKTDGVQKSDSFNVLLKYAIDNPKLFGRVYITFYKSTFAQENDFNYNYSYKSLSVEQYANLPKERVIAQKDGLFYTNGTLRTCTSCLQTYACLYSFQLTDEIFMNLAFYATGKKNELDTLTKSYWQVLESFMKKNDLAIKTMRYPFFPEEVETAEDSFVYSHKKYLFCYPKNWSCNNPTRMENDAVPNILLNPIQMNATSNDPVYKITVLDDSLSIFDKRGLRKNTGKICNDSIAIYRMTYTQNTPFTTVTYDKYAQISAYYFVSDVRYYLKFKDSTDVSKTFCFSLTYPTTNLLNFVYYKETLRELIGSFIEMNKLVVDPTKLNLN